MTNARTCCISTRKVAYASEVSSRMKPWEYGTKHVLKMTEDEFAVLQMPDSIFTHDFLITAAFITETSECSLTSTNTKVFYL